MSGLGPFMFTSTLMELRARHNVPLLAEHAPIQHEDPRK